MSYLHIYYRTLFYSWPSNELGHCFAVDRQTKKESFFTVTIKRRKNPFLRWPSKELVPSFTVTIKRIRTKFHSWMSKELVPRFTVTIRRIRAPFYNVHQLGPILLYKYVDYVPNLEPVLQWQLNYIGPRFTVTIKRIRATFYTEWP